MSKVMSDIIGLLNNSNSGSSNESGNESDLSNIVDTKAAQTKVSKDSKWQNKVLVPVNPMTLYLDKEHYLYQIG